MKQKDGATVNDTTLERDSEAILKSSKMHRTAGAGKLIVSEEPVDH